jgi:energy-coupling factor transporter ATP-binding protein EcfA2
MPQLTDHHIRSIYVHRLFGRYTYAVPRTKDKRFEDINILYGENGRGKTTLLHLVFHLLSASSTRGHKTYVANVPFQKLEVVLRDGTVVAAEKDAQLLTGPTTFIVRTAASVSTWTFRPNAPNQFNVRDLPEKVDFNLLPPELRDSVRQTLAERDLFNALTSLRVLPILLTSDRILLSDGIEVTRRRTPSNAPERTLAEAVAEQRKTAVAEALKKASEWLQNKLLQGVYWPSSVSYENVIARIAATPDITRFGLSKSQAKVIRDTLFDRVQWINTKSEELTRIGAAGFSVSPNLLSHVETAGGTKLHLIETILTPHLDELQQRLQAIWPTFELIQNFTSIVNRFFRDKQMRFAFSDGLRIMSSGIDTTSELKPEHLSSGEQQLMLIFCHVLTSRDKPSIFVIDEPEISLNMLWQRMLVSSLEELAGESECQFLFASHSIEILAKHNSRVLELEDA